MPWDTVGSKIYKYCLNIVDVASRYKASVPLINRSSKSVARAFKRVYSSRKLPLIWPKVLQVDGGSEFKDDVLRMMRWRGTQIRVGSTHKHQCIVERYNKTLAEKLFRIQDAIEFITDIGIENTAWVNNLQDVVDYLNNSITQLIGMAPVVAILEDEVFALPSKIRKDRLVGEDEECLPSGTLVRYLLDNSDYKGGRRRATDPIWSTKIFTIESMTVKSRQPVMYRLIDMDTKHSIPKKYFV